MTENPCHHCPTNCCDGFIVGNQLSNPHGFQQILETYPFIQPIDPPPQSIIRHPIRLKCLRFDQDTGTCIGHDDPLRPRPFFCHSAGNDYPPHPNCQMYRRHHPTN